MNFWCPHVEIVDGKTAEPRIYAKQQRVWMSSDVFSPQAWSMREQKSVSFSPRMVCGAIEPRQEGIEKRQ